MFANVLWLDNYDWNLNEWLKDHAACTGSRLVQAALYQTSKERMTTVDFQGHELTIGDTVIFISGPNSLNKGILTRFKPLSRGLTVVEIVVTLDNGTSHSLTAAPFVCAKMLAN